jgi:hypothetical protein
MDLIVKGMADLPIPEEMLRELDVPGLLQSFKNDYDKLDNLKNARVRHENRNILSRKIHSGELKEAQLDAAELQASFSKKLGQLWLISHAQARLLDKQQQDLQRQQNQIKQQTGDIANANVTIEKQQNKLSDQQGQLEKLIKDYFNLKGLTMDGARQLIQIAEEIKCTKSSLMDTFEAEHRVLLELQQSVEDCTRQQLAQSEELGAFHEHVRNAMTVQSERFDASIAARCEDLDVRLRRQREQLHAEQQSMKEQQEQQITQQCQLIERQLAELKLNIATKVFQAKRLAIIGLCSTSVAFLWLLWVH